MQRSDCRRPRSADLKIRMRQSTLHPAQRQPHRYGHAVAGAEVPRHRHTGLPVHVSAAPSASGVPILCAESTIVFGGLSSLVHLRGSVPPWLDVTQPQLRAESRQLRAVTQTAIPQTPWHQKAEGLLPSRPLLRSGRAIPVHVRSPPPRRLLRFHQVS